MHNWSTNLKRLSKYPEEYKIWRLEQLINFGLGKEKIKRSDLKKYLSKISIDPQKKEYLEYLLSLHE